MSCRIPKAVCEVACDEMLTCSAACTGVEHRVFFVSVTPPGPLSPHSHELHLREVPKLWAWLAADLAADWGLDRGNAAAAPSESEVLLSVAFPWHPTTTPCLFMSYRAMPMQPALCLV